MVYSKSTANGSLWPTQASRKKEIKLRAEIQEIEGGEKNNRRQQN